ncbi:MAG: hypothetical protein ACFCUR_20530 [Rhodomicrobiaceae bacterium]
MQKGSVRATALQHRIVIGYNRRKWGHLRGMMGRVVAIGGVFCVLLGLAGLKSAHAADQIEWRLVNSFRLFKKPEDMQLHREIYRTLSGLDRSTPVLAAERKLATRFKGRGWAEGVFNHTCYDQNADRYNACPDYVLPKTHRIAATLKSETHFWDFLRRSNDHETCHWQLKSLAGQQLARKTAPCGKAVNFDIPYPDGARLGVSRWAGEPGMEQLIKVRDLLIVGMGDSFGAGEGNPDDPVRFNDARSHDYGRIEIAATGEKIALDGYPAREGNWSALRGSGFHKERARWWDRECHRSLYSHQLRAALQLAVEDPQRAVTFLNFSCAGAEIVEGVLLDATVRECSPGESFSVPAQISALSRELCRSTSRNAAMPAAIIQRMPELKNRTESALRLTRCQTVTENGRTRPALKRPIDLVFLSVGGNDVGFTPLVADSILSGSSIYRRIGQHNGAVYGVAQARKRLDVLKKRFDGLKFALELFFDIGRDTKVVLTGYPKMGYDADGMSACGGQRGMEVFPAFHLDASKVGEAEGFSRELNRSLAEFAGRDWRYVDGFREDFRSRGLCAASGGDPADNLAFPRFINGEWTPYKPSEYAPYAERQRWFRTPNDAYMTAHMHAQAVSSFGSNCSGLFSGTLRTLARRHWQPFQLFLASTYGGAFHPTAEGQARMADDVVKAARAALDAD